jgi:hypothetical protein
MSRGRDRGRRRKAIAEGAGVTGHPSEHAEVDAGAAMGEPAEYGQDPPPPEPQTHNDRDRAATGPKSIWGGGRMGQRFRSDHATIVGVDGSG